MCGWFHFTLFAWNISPQFKEEEKNSAELSVMWRLLADYLEHLIKHWLKVIEMYLTSFLCTLFKFEIED